MKTVLKYACICLLPLFVTEASGQYCTTPADTIYSMSSQGEIYPLNVSNALPGPMLGASTNDTNSNGVGFSAFNGRFYYFNRCAALSAPAVQFAAYVPATATTIPLAAPPATILATHKIRSGCVDNSGTGYYTINPNNTSPAVPYLYYYNIALDTWTTITDTFKNTSGTVVANIKSLNSGDMAFDGLGNLWLLCSNGSNYALYRINAPVPTSPVQYVVVDTIISQRATPASSPSGASFTGIAFNSEGKLYISTGAGVNTGNNKLYELATATSSLTLIGTLPNGYGDDLTSCSYPMGVLAVTWLNFTASLNNGSARLLWQVNETSDITAYDVEYSIDDEHWQVIARITKNDFNAGSQKTYSYSHDGVKEGSNYYRIVQLSASEKKSTSSVKVINTKTINRIHIGPNPAKDILYLYDKNNSSKLLAQIFNKNGQLIWSAVVAPNQQSIDISHLPRGSFVLRLLSGTTNETVTGHQFIKW